MSRADGPPLITLVCIIKFELFMPIVVASLVVNVFVAGFFGLATGFNLNSILPKLDVVFGPDTPSRRILPWWNLVISALHAASLWAVFSGQGHP